MKVWRIWNCLGPTMWCVAAGTYYEALTDAMSMFRLDNDLDVVLEQ